MAVASKLLQSTSAACLAAMLLTFQVGNVQAWYTQPPLTENVPDNFKFAFGVIFGADIFDPVTGFAKNSGEVNALSVDGKYQYFLNIKKVYDGALADYAKYSASEPQNFKKINAYAVLASAIEAKDRLGGAQQAYYLANNALDYVYRNINDPNVKKTDVTVTDASGNTVRGNKVVSFIESLTKYNAAIKRDPSLSDKSNPVIYTPIQRFKFVYDSIKPLIDDYGRWSAAYNGAGCKTSIAPECQITTALYNTAAANIKKYAENIAIVFENENTDANIKVIRLQNSAHYFKFPYYPGAIFGSNGYSYDTIRKDLPIVLSLIGDPGLYPHLLASKSVSNGSAAVKATVRSLKTTAAGPIRISAAAPLSAAVAVAVASKASIIPVSKTLHK